ncbi:hypothetical protein [Aromatoleum toluclasticum]|uniref:hypothetical protein n=1 Tax=Aromatoleum toluclasticum TaxID=92003 RepID=UPI00036EDDE5|nr:hypothetical protein [Aromatoleum toluclasticum]
MKLHPGISVSFYAAASLAFGLHSGLAPAQEATTTATTTAELEPAATTVTTDGTAAVSALRSKGAMPVQSVETVTNADGTTTVTRTRTLSATGAAPKRVRSKEMTFNAEGGLASQTTTEVRTASDGTVLSERSSSRTIAGGEVAHARGDSRPAAERPDNAEHVARAERPEKLDRVERLERVERPEKPERVERIERRERD